MNAKKKNIQKRGVDYTTGLRKLVPYGKIRKNIYIPQLHIELDFREVLYDQDNKTDNVTNLITLLKQDENIRHTLDDKGFRSLTDFQWYL